MGPLLAEPGALFEAVLGLLWPFLRISAALLAGPILGSQAMPVQVRVLLAVAITVVVGPLIPPSPDVDPISFAGLLLAGQQVLIGVAMGFILAMVFSVLAQAGEAVALGMGLGFASINDPVGGVTVPVVSQYYSIVGTLVFLTLGGHGLLIEAVVRSFETLPVGLPSLDVLEVQRIVLWGSEMFGWGVLIALPAVAAMLLVNLAFGVMTRSAPQLNVLAVGLPLMLLIGLGAMLVTLPAVLDALSDLFAEAFRLLGVVIGAGG